AQWTSQAERRWIEFYMDWDARSAQPLVMAATKRVDAYVCKMSMTYAALEGTLPYVELDQLEAAIAVGKYAAACAEHLIELQTAQSNPQGELAQRYIKWVRNHEGERLRVMQQRMWKYTNDAEQFNRIVDNLCKADIISIRDRKVYIAS